jgi:hypothetical protein
MKLPKLFSLSFTNVIIITIIVLLIGAIAFYLLQQRTSKPPTEPTPPQETKQQEALPPKKMTHQESVRANFEKNKHSAWDLLMAADQQQKQPLVPKEPNDSDNEYEEDEDGNYDWSKYLKEKTEEEDIQVNADHKKALNAMLGM